MIRNRKLLSLLVIALTAFTVASPRAEVMNLVGFGAFTFISDGGGVCASGDMSNGTTITTPGGDCRVVPAGVTSIDIELWGGGGGGNPGFLNSISSPGGGGGGCASYNNLAVTPGDIISFTVGNAGTAFPLVSPGNSTVTSPSMTANAGVNGSSGGAASGGTTNNSGANGGSASGTTGGTGGNAGAGINVSGGTGGAGATSTTNSIAGSTPGAGGGGGSLTSGRTSGSAGAHGGIRFSW
jgi:hypothetical protein